MKEAVLESKLRAVADQWALEAFTFAEHKQRGLVILKVGKKCWLPWAVAVPGPASSKGTRDMTFGRNLHA